ncbi:hypothetical protein [Flavobacterium sp. FlaQc-48]|uniref:hypothetical protein n=1 Tax=Flavobacterium sp. FlaQc-48 TaxID=3374181 RepID=UPI003756600B
MGKGKILLYDTKKKFFKILKYAFKKDFVFDVYSDITDFEALLDEYSSAVFVIYSESNLKEFMRVSQKGVPIIVCTSKQEIFEKLKDINEIFLYDCSKIKSEMVVELKNYFSFEQFVFHSISIQ